SVLTPQEVENLFTTLRHLASEGCSILYISHKLQEIKALCHRATIMRAGRVVAACDSAAETARSMAEKMMGRTITAPVRAKRPGDGAARLAVTSLSLASPRQHGTDLKDVSFEVR